MRKNSKHAKLKYIYLVSYLIVVVEGINSSNFLTNSSSTLGYD